MDEFDLFLLDNGNHDYKLYKNYSQHQPTYKNYVNDLFMRYKEFLDKDFAKQFRENFYQKYSELLILDRIVKIVPYKNIRPKFKKKGSPDFVVDHEGVILNIEITCPNKPKDINNGYSKNDFVYKCINSSIDEKNTKFKGYLKKGILPPESKNILVISGLELRNFYTNQGSFAHEVQESIIGKQKLYCYPGRTTLEQEYDQLYFKKPNGTTIKSGEKELFSNLSSIIYFDMDLLLGVSTRNFNILYRDIEFENAIGNYIRGIFN
jgi:hypothetical protein